MARASPPHHLAGTQLLKGAIVHHLRYHRARATTVCCMIEIITIAPATVLAGHQATFRGLGFLPGGQNHSETFAISSDGHVAVGVSWSPAGYTAVRVQNDGVWQDLGDLPGSTVEAVAYGVSSDGSAVVGTSQSSRGREAFVWTA